jgi:hypothetical protein
VVRTASNASAEDASAQTSLAARDASKDPPPHAPEPCIQLRLRMSLRSLDDLGHAYMAKVDRELEWRLAEDHRLVEVAGCHRQRAHNRLPLVSPLRFGRLLPYEAAGVLQYQ